MFLVSGVNGKCMVMMSLSHSKVWKSSAIFIEEDDAQDGVHTPDAMDSLAVGDRSVGDAGHELGGADARHQAGSSSAACGLRTTCW